MLAVICFLDSSLNLPWTKSEHYIVFFCGRNTSGLCVISTFWATRGNGNNIDTSLTNKVHPMG